MGVCVCVYVSHTVACRQTLECSMLFSLHVDVSATGAFSICQWKLAITLRSTSQRFFSVTSCVHSSWPHHPSPYISQSATLPSTVLSTHCESRDRLSSPFVAWIKSIDFDVWQLIYTRVCVQYRAVTGWTFRYSRANQESIEKVLQLAWIGWFRSLGSAGNDQFDLRCNQHRHEWLFFKIGHLFPLKHRYCTGKNTYVRYWAT